MLLTLLEQYRADRSMIEIVLSLNRGEELRVTDESTGWLVLAITMQLCQNSLTFGPSLDSRLKRIVNRAWSILERSDRAEADFEPACLRSNSEWDAFTRSLTLDQPAMLSIYLGAVKK
jgi:hypothetical protein